MNSKIIDFERQKQSKKDLTKDLVRDNISRGFCVVLVRGYISRVFPRTRQLFAGFCLVRAHVRAVINVNSFQRSHDQLSPSDNDRERMIGKE